MANPPRIPQDFPIKALRPRRRDSTVMQNPMECSQLLPSLLNRLEVVKSGVRGMAQQLFRHIRYMYSCSTIPMSCEPFVPEIGIAYDMCVYYAGLFHGTDLGVNQKVP